MTRDELEFSISQYLDGTLAPAEVNALETQLATDAEARALYAEYKSLQGVLTSAPMPDVKWDDLAASISAVVSREELPAQSYKIAAWFKPARLAIAASVLVAAGVAFSVFRPAGKLEAPQTVAVAPTRIILNDYDSAPVTAVAAVAARPEPILRVAIGPAPTDAADRNVLRYADSVVQRPSKASIVSAAPLGQDTLQTPF